MKDSRDESAARGLHSEEKPRRLPVFNWQGVDFFVDERLRQFRETKNPHNFIDFDSEAGRKMLEDAVRVTCRPCRAETVVSRHTTEDSARCFWCERKTLRDPGDW